MLGCKTQTGLAQPRLGQKLGNPDSKSRSHTHTHKNPSHWALPMLFNNYTTAGSLLSLLC